MSGRPAGAEQGVADGMGQRVGIGVAVEAERRDELHATEHERPPRGRAVNV